VTQRFSDRGRYAWEFAHEYAVVCPRGDHKATVFPDALSWRAKSARVTCTSCGFSADWSTTKYRAPAQWRAPNRSSALKPSRRQAAPADPFFSLPLWFVADAKGGVFWAYNAAHLEFIKNYVGATLRIRQPHVNASLASRLPAFLLDRRNRGAVLHAINELERRGHG
jgi:hypothetical protein